MKRLVVIIILLFPVLTLVIWVYYGFTRPRPPVINPPATATNLNSSVISNQP